MEPQRKRARTRPGETPIKAVCRPDYGNEVEYLTVFVNQLRRKIEPDPAQARYLLADPWRGYRFGARGFDPLGPPLEG